MPGRGEESGAGYNFPPTEIVISRFSVENEQNASSILIFYRTIQLDLPASTYGGDPLWNHSTVQVTFGIPVAHSVTTASMWVLEVQ